MSGTASAAACLLGAQPPVVTTADAQHHGREQGVEQRAGQDTDLDLAVALGAGAEGQLASAASLDQWPMTPWKRASASSRKARTLILSA
jgi:hypothetical protein